jgi:tetratricopeptide (TPR) repeat protein
MSSQTANTTINWTSLPNAVYYYNVTLTDLAGNKNTTETREITLDTTYPLVSFMSPTANTSSYVPRGWIYANVSVTETNPANITFRLYNSTNGYTLVNSTTYSMSSQTANTTVNWTSLPDTTYYYNATISDYAANTNSTETRNITIDTTNPHISFVNPTPENNSGSIGSFQLNVSIYDINFANLTYTWNGTSRTENASSPNITSLGSGYYMFNITQEIGETGGSFIYSVQVTDLAGNSNQTGNRTIRGNIPPAFLRISYAPNTTMEMDPNITITINANISDINFDTAKLQWKNATADGWANVTMNNLTAKGLYTILANASLTPTYESNYTFRIWANDTEGEFNTSAETNISVYYDWTWAVNRTNLDLTVAGVFSSTREIGNFTINNTGDYNLSFSISDDSPYDPTGYPKGCGLLYNGSCAIVLYQISSNQSSKASATFMINATFGIAVREDSLTITIIASPAANASPRNTTLNLTLATYAGGPYFDARIDSYEASINQSQTTTLGAYLKNIGNETAENVTVNWTFPTGFTITSGNSTSSIENITTGTQQRVDVNITISPSLVRAGVYTVYLNASAHNNSINDSDYITIAVYCSSEDGVCGSGCTYDEDSANYDSDCTAPSSTTTVTSSGGGGSLPTGGMPDWQRQKLLQTNETYELVRGKEEKFFLNVENPFSGSFENVSVTIKGFLAQYLSVTPPVITTIPIGKTVAFSIWIEAPTYFTKGAYNLNFTITGIINETQITGNTTVRKLTNVKEHRLVTLIIHEISNEEAENYLNSTAQLIKRLNSSSLSTAELTLLLSQAYSDFQNKNFETAKAVYEKAKDMSEKAFATLSLIQEVEELLRQAAYNGIKVPKTERLLLLAKAALERGDYATSLQRINDAKLTYALESLGLFNIFAYVTNNWPVLSVEAIVLIIIGYFSFLGIKLNLINRKLKTLRKEEQVLLGLIKEVQKECFEKGKLSMKEYLESTLQYEKKMGKVVQDTVRLETAKSNMFRFLKGSYVRLIEERKKLLEMIKQTQKIYMESGKLETRIYENRMRSYVERVTEIEEEIANLEAKRVMKRRRWFR